MNIFRYSLPDRASISERDVLAHWVWVVPILLVVAALGLRQIDLYPPTPDEFYSMHNAGWLVGGPFTPLDVIESLYNISPNHVPGYFILLSLWGNFTSYDIASARLLGIFSGLLSLAVFFRLARDFAGPAIGFFAVIIIASNAYYNFFIPHARMYSLMMLLGGLVLWLYLRIVFQLRNAQRRDYFALGAAIFVFLHVHSFSVAFLLVLAAFHLGFVAREQRWYRLSLTVLAASLLAGPAYLVVVTRGISLSLRDWGAAASSSWDNIATWLELATNGQPLLVMISVVGLLLAVQDKLPRLKTMCALVFIHFVVMSLLSDLTQYLITTNMRYLLPAFLIFALLMAAGIQAFYRYHWLLVGLLIMLWPIAGILFQLDASWNQFLAGRVFSFSQPPWQVIASMASDTESNPMIIGYGISDDLLEWSSRIDYSQRQHYFDNNGLGTNFSADPHEFKLAVRFNELNSPRIWVLYRHALIAEAEIQVDDSAISFYDYELCGMDQAGVDTVILDYAWSILDCSNPEKQLEARTAFHEFQFYGARVSADRSNLSFVDSWSSTGDIAHEEYRMSFQLISADWENVAQVDLPLVHEGMPRRFSIDITGVAPGTYRLMAIFYNIHSGERADWLDNETAPRTMLALQEVVLP